LSMSSALHLFSLIVDISTKHNNNLS